MNHVDIETAEKLSGIKAYTIRREIRKNNLAALKFSGGRYLIEPTALADFAARYRASKFDGRYKKA